MANLEEKINQAIADFDDIEKAIEESGVDVPYDTDTSQYGDLIRQIKGRNGGNSITLTDITTGKKYIVYVQNGQLTMEESEV